MKEIIQCGTRSTDELCKPLFESKASKIRFEIEDDDSLTESALDSEASTIQEGEEDKEAKLVKTQNKIMSLWNEILH
ncbi:MULTISPECIES: hypothetical protein [unclassified Paenibacillus]|uniref:hypothetical protein n=1 Tax=unclassified Paenibacillus TaxID=185978 RepID=UPI00362EEA28